MKRLTALLILLGPFVLPAQNNTSIKNCVPCEQLTKLELPNVTILKATLFKKTASMDRRSLFHSAVYWEE